MWTRCSRVIWLCLTKQHSQTHEFLLGPFSHHWSETEGRQAERQNEREWDQGRWERKHFFGMKQNTITRETCFSYVHIPLQDTGKGKKRQFMDGEKEAEISWSEKFRNVLCVKVSGLSGTRSAMTWLAVSLKLRRLIGCGTFHSLTHLNLHSHWCRPIKLYLTARDSWNVINLLQNHVLNREMWMFYWRIGNMHKYFGSPFSILLNIITLSAAIYGLISNNIPSISPAVKSSGSHFQSISTFSFYYHQSSASPHVSARDIRLWVPSPLCPRG